MSWYQRTIIVHEASYGHREFKVADHVFHIDVSLASGNILFGYSEKEFESNDVSMHFKEFLEPPQWCWNATQSNILYKEV